jgi:hypothetical protein
VLHWEERIDYLEKKNISSKSKSKNQKQKKKEQKKTVNPLNKFKNISLRGHKLGYNHYIIICICIPFKFNNITTQSGSIVMNLKFPSLTILLNGDIPK